MQERVDRLEAELREVRSNTRDEVNTLADRVEAAEAKVGDAPAASGSVDQRLNDLQDSVNRIAAAQKSGDNMAYLRPNLNGHTPLPTDHGTFLVRIEGIDLDVASGKYSVHLNIGNPMALAVQQFTLRGDHGGGIPQLKDGEEYSIYNKKIEEWQRTLSPFEATVTKTLEPESWTPFDIQVEADSREQLELIRFEMMIENAHLERKEASAGGSQHGHIVVDSGAASVLKTDYGAFLISVKKAEPSASGTRLHIEIGNPYGFTINQCRLIGDYGEMVPKRDPTESSQAFAERLQTWTNTLLPFDSNVEMKLSSFRWNKATIIVPGPPEKVKFLRAQLRVENVTLPNAK